MMDDLPLSLVVRGAMCGACFLSLTCTSNVIILVGFSGVEWWVDGVV